MNVPDAIATLKELKACAQEAGIYHAWFLSFGTLLGAVRGCPRTKGGMWYREPMANDDDMDIGILSDKITKEQESAYVELLIRRGMFEHRAYVTHSQRRSDTNRHVWFSVRKNKAEDGGTRCCHWCWQPYNGWYWHSKGVRWVAESKFKQAIVGWNDGDEAVCLGIKRELVEILIPVSFCGETFNIPATFGACLDWWYTGWNQLKSTASAHKMYMIVKRWESNEHRIVQG